MLTTLLSCLLTGIPGSLDVRVDGPGLLRFLRDGRAVYAKTARLMPIGGRLCAEGGVPVAPAISVEGAIEVDLQGRVFQVSTGGRREAGRLVLALFPNESALTASGSYLLASERPRLVDAGEDAVGVIRCAGRPLTQVTEAKATHAAVSGRPKLAIRAHSEVEGDALTLGAIAEISGPDAGRLAAVDLGRTPPLGIVRKYDRIWIEARLRLAGFAPDRLDLIVPAEARVARKGQTIAWEAFVARARQAVAERAGIELPLICDRESPDFVGPTGSVELQVESFTQSHQGFTVGIGICVDGRRINSRTVGLKPDPSVKGVTAGQPVKILLRSSGATVEVAGKANAAGWIGQAVKVTTATGSVHLGIVTGAGSVEVRL